MATDIEILKSKVDGLDIWSHIEEASKVGFEAMNQELVPLFKWYGVYAQKPKEDGFFMMRIKIPGGKLNSQQLIALNEIANQYARAVADITTRQAIQLHWIRIEDIPNIINKLASVGMDTAGGCGDIMRNITGCPLAGLIAEEIFDASDELELVDKFFNRNKDFSNLPRKYKVSITGCSTWCSQPDINCLSLVGIQHEGRFGFGLKIGGGLSTKPMIAKNFPVFIERKQALEVIRAATTVYRDFGFRDKRHKARIKFLVEDWGVDKFLLELEKNLGYQLERIPEINPIPEYFHSPKVSHHDHLGITKLKNSKYAVGIAFVSGRTSNNDLQKIAQLIDEFCDKDGQARTTNKQNLIVVNIPETNLEAFLQRAKEFNLKIEYSAFTKLGVACTGTEFCNLAIVETKARAKKIFDYLDLEFPGLQEELMISVTGCPNNCAQYSIADIGLVGCKVEKDGAMQDAFRIFLGGRLGFNAQFGQALNGRYLHENIHLTLKALLDFYLSNKTKNEKFSNFIDRLGLEKIQEDVLIQCI